MDIIQYKYWLLIFFAIVMYFVKRYYGSELYGKPSESYKQTPEKLFWDKIEKARNIASNNYEIQCQKLVALLKTESPEYIMQFNEIFNDKLDKAYTWKLWAAAYVINGGCSDDAFIDFRSWLIGQGEMIFEGAIKSPDSLSNIDIETDEWEGLQYCANQAYKELMEQDIPPDEMIRSLEPKGDKWDEGNAEQLKAMLPHLSLKYNSI